MATIVVHHDVHDGQPRIFVCLTDGDLTFMAFLTWADANRLNAEIAKNLHLSMVAAAAAEERDRAERVRP